MVRQIHKKILLPAVAFSLLTLAVPLSGASATDVNFQVNVSDVLSVSLTVPDNWASGNVDIEDGSDLLRNKVILDVVSNNAAGFTASMASKDTTNLVNQARGKSSVVIPTLASATTAGSFPSNRWGYSTNDTDAGSTSANYYALQTSAIVLANPTSAGSISRNIYFGARADATKDSGTYANTVVISVVTGVIDENTNPVTPVDPVPPIPDGGDNPQYDSTANHTVYTSTSAGANQTLPVQTTTTTTTTQISTGDTRSSYAAPQGVTTSNINEGTPLATGLAATAGIAAVAGVGFFIAAKRKKDDDEEEQQ